MRKPASGLFFWHPFRYNQCLTSTVPTPMFHPFKYRYSAKILREEGEYAVLQISSQKEDKLIHFPISMLPQGLAVNDQFTLTLQPEESAKREESETLKQLLQELIS